MLASAIFLFHNLFSCSSGGTVSQSPQVHQHYGGWDSLCGATSMHSGAASKGDRFAVEGTTSFLEQHTANRKVNRHLPEVSAKCWRYDRRKMGVGCAAINTNVRLSKTGSFMWDSYIWLCLGDLLTSAVTIMVMAVSSESSMTSKLNTSHTNLFSGSFKEIVSSIVTLFTAEQDWVIHADPPSGMLVQVNIGSQLLPWCYMCQQF